MDIRKSNVCFRCSRSCFIMHMNKNDGSPTSFFKIMFGQKFDELLVMPPMFSKKVKTLVGRKMTLEDSSQRKWDVKLSDVNGSLAFQKGWRNFVLDHNIKIGDLLVFHYVRHEHFLVEIFGRSGCPKVSDIFEDKDRTSETTRSYTPTKRQDSYEQPIRKRFCDRSKSVREPPAMARTVPTRVHIRERSPTVVPLADTHEDPCFMTSREKDRSKLDLVVETQVDPHLTTNTPKVVQEADTLVEPCFMTSRDTIFIDVDDGDRLFDLSAFEMPNKKSTINMEEKTHCGVDLPVSDIPENVQHTVTGMSESSKFSALSGVKMGLNNQETKVYNQELNGNAESESSLGTKLSIGELNSVDLGGDMKRIKQELADVKQNTCGDVMVDSCETQLLRLECAPLSSSPSKADSPIDSIMPLKIIDKPETSEFSALPGVKTRSNSLETKVSDLEFCGGKSDNAEGGSSLGTKSSIGERNSVDLGGEMRRIKQELTHVKQNTCGDLMVDSCETQLLRLECAPLSSSPPKAASPIDSIMPLNIIGEPETSEFSALPGGKARSNNLETKLYNQEFCGGGKSGNAEGGSPLSTKISTGKLTAGDLGGYMQHIKQESRGVKQDILCGDATVSSCFGGIFSTSDPTNFSCGDFAENFNPVVKSEANAYAIVKQEPVHCNAPFASDFEVICSVPADSEYFLELPEPLPVAFKVYKNRGIKHKHQLVFLRDDGRRLWPVVYHYKNGFNVLTSGWTTFMKAYNIQPGDDCIFTAENAEECMFNVAIVRHD